MSAKKQIDSNMTGKESKFDAISQIKSTARKPAGEPSTGTPNNAGNGFDSMQEGLDGGVTSKG